MYAIGSALPWITITAAFVGTITRSGIEGGDGIITVGIGIAIALVGIARRTGNKAAGSKLGAVALALVAVGFAIFEISSVNQRIDSLDADVAAFASVGIGLWLMISGAIVAALGALSLKR